MESSRIATNGVELHVTDWGGEGRSILFAHPTGFLGAIWRPVIERLRALGVSDRIIAYDERGHGLSSKPDTGYEWEKLFADLAGLLDRLEIHAALGVGHSAGATTLACTAADNPGRFRSLVLVDPILFRFDPELVRASGAKLNPMAARTRTRRLVWSSREELLDSFRARPPYDTWTEEALAAYAQYGTFERPDGEIELLCPGRIEAQVYENAPASNPFAYLGRLEVPTLLVRGGHSQSFDEAQASAALGAIAGSRLVTIEDATHFVPMEHPDKIAELVVAELGS